MIRQEASQSPPDLIQALASSHATLSTPRRLNLTLGFDIGVTGALAVLEDGQLSAVYDLPIHVHGKLKWAAGRDLLALLRRHVEGSEETTRVIIEDNSVIPRGEGGAPRAGTDSIRLKGSMLASVAAVLDVAYLSYELVRPDAWKRAYGLSMPTATDTQKKHASLCRARELFPRAPLHLAKHSDRAEALLIARYGYTLAAKRETANAAAATPKRRRVKSAVPQPDLLSGLPTA